MFRRRRSKPSFLVRHGRAAEAIPPGELLLEHISAADLHASHLRGSEVRKLHTFQFGELESQRMAHRAEIDDALRGINGISLNVDGWCRAIKIRYAMSPLSCAGSMRTSGRFNFGGDVDDGVRFAPFPALYIAKDRPTAMCELLQHKQEAHDALSPEAFGLLPDASLGWLALKGQVHNIFDLTQPGNLKPFLKITRSFTLSSGYRRFERSLGFNRTAIVQTPAILMASIMDPKWRTFPMHLDLPANSQIFGQLVAAAGFDGLLYESARAGGQALVIYPRNLMASETRIAVVDPPEGASHTIMSATTHTQFG